MQKHIIHNINESKVLTFITAQVMMNSLPRSCREVLIKITTTNNCSLEVKNNQEPLRMRQWLEACWCWNAGLCNDGSWPGVCFWGESSASAGGDVAHTQPVLPGTAMHFRRWTVDAAICSEITTAHLKIIHSVRVITAMPVFYLIFAFCSNNSEQLKNQAVIFPYTIKYESKTVPVGPSIPTSRTSPTARSDWST